MSISHAKPFSRLRFIMLAALAAVGMAIATFGAAEAQAHGTCTTSVVGPTKTAFGNIRGEAVFTCTSTHRILKVTAHIERLRNGTWVQVGDEGFARANDDTTVRAVTTVPCGGTDDYRVVGRGVTGTDTTVSPHISQTPGARAQITCTTGDLTNTGALLELATSRLGNVATG